MGKGAVHVIQAYIISGIPIEQMGKGEAYTIEDKPLEQIGKGTVYTIHDEPLEQMGTGAFYIIQSIYHTWHTIRADGKGGILTGCTIKTHGKEANYIVQGITL